jgi:hypothetical protein
MPALSLWWISGLVAEDTGKRAGALRCFQTWNRYRRWVKKTQESHWARKSSMVV